MFNLDDAIDPKTEIIEVAFSNLDTDIGAIYKDEVLSALAGVYANPDKSQWQRIYHRLKKHRIASEVQRAIIIFSRKTKFKISSTTKPATNQRQTSNKPATNQKLNTIHW